MSSSVASFGERRAAAMTRRRLGAVAVVCAILPAAVSFLLPQAEARAPKSVQQLVRLRDHEGRLWIAAYLLQRQAGAGWRISACVVAPDSDRWST